MVENKSIVVTGGSGFLGANLIRKLNGLGYKNIIIIDNYDEKKFHNISSLSFADYISCKKDLADIKKALGKHPAIAAILHVGANADVLVRDADIMLEANYEHSKFYLELATERNIPLIYASSSAVYGNLGGAAEPNKENPHNIYAWSKWLFDKHVTANMSSFSNRVVGLRLFNIFGMGEFHKGKNASLPFRFFSFIKDNGFIDIFDRQIERDYVWVEDVADVIIQILKDTSVSNGIYDLGGNNPVSHQTCAGIVADAFVERKIKPAKGDLIRSVPMPADLVDSFQFYTKANNLLPLIARQTAGNEKKIHTYINQLLDLTYGTD